MVQPLPRLADMPHHIKSSIVADVDFQTRWSLYKVSKEFRDVVRKCPFDFEIVRVRIAATTKYKIYVVERHVIYEITRVKRPEETYSNFRQRVARDLLVLFRHRDTRVQTMLFIGRRCIDDGGPPDIYDPKEFLEEFNRQMSQLQHLLNCKRLKVDWYIIEMNLEGLLPHFKPRILEKIDLRIEHEHSVRAASLLEQWKQTKWISLKAPGNLTETGTYYADYFRVIESRSYISYDHLKFAIEKMMEQQPIKYRICRIVGGDWEDDDFIPRVCADLNAVYAANGTFIKLPNSDGYLKVSSSYERSLIVLKIFPASMMSKWPKNVLDEDEGNDSDDEMSVFDSDVEDEEFSDEEEEED